MNALFFAILTSGAAAGESSADRLARYLTGDFDSVDQAEANPEYFPVRLRVCPVAIPALGERVLYVEQSITGESPYRQRFYTVSAVGDAPELARTEIYSMTDPASMVGYCDAPGERALPTRAAITSREGCGVTVSWDGEVFRGATGERTCESVLRGASWATAKIVVTEGAMSSWDQGWDASGAQVWGAVAGPYEFTLRAR